MIAALKLAVERVLAAEGGSRRQGARALSATYKAGGSSAKIDLAAYLTARLPATYAAVDRVIKETAALRPDLMPSSMIDVGSGPGTAAWAATHHWPSLASVCLLDNNRAFLDLALQLASSGSDAMRQAAGVVASLDHWPAGLSADLVVAAYALAELPAAGAASAARHLWARTGQLLVVVEPGTPQGFSRIRAAREALVGQGGVPIGPCPHAATCPMEAPDWCHFSVRLARSRAHMHAKGASVPFEDEKFSWIALARDGATSGGARVLSPARHTKAGVDLKLCTPDGLDLRHVARRDVTAYKQVRKADWGDLL